jgi:hypothetical protein
MSIIKGKKPRKYRNGKAIVLLKTVREGILSEKAIKKNGYNVRKVAPPVKYRKGCEIAVEIDIDKKEEIKEILKKYGIENQGIIEL